MALALGHPRAVQMMKKVSTQKAAALPTLLISCRRITVSYGGLTSHVFVTILLPGEIPEIG
jgi:hypothetical protein